MDIILIVLRLIHILGGMFWVGGAVIAAAFLVPAIRASRPDGNKFMQQLVGKQNASMYISIASWSAVLAGVLLYWRASLGFQLAWILAPSGLTYTIGALSGIIELAVGIFFSARTAARMQELAKEMQSAGGPPKPEQLAEMQKLQALLANAGVWGAILLVISASAMAIARYV